MGTEQVQNCGLFVDGLKENETNIGGIGLPVAISLNGLSV